MSRYIDADKAVRLLQGRLMETANNNCGFKCDAGSVFQDAAERIPRWIDEMPTAQPEIIRCKECLWRIGRDCTRFTDLPVYMDDYCGRAKRRGEQDEVN